MKMTFCAMMAVAMLFVLSPLSQAQIATSAVPSEDAPIAETVQDNQADTQASVSDNVVVGDADEIAAPIQPIVHIICA